MKKKLRKLCIRLFMPGTILNPLGCYCYHLTFRFLNTFWKWRFPDYLLWSRNSFVTNDIIPGLSDIDLTLVSQRDDENDLAFEWINWFKRFFIIIGEVNCYSPSSLKILKELYNSDELNRDPFLCQYLGIIPQENEIDHLVYLLRLFESDVENLKLRPFLRERKWKRVFQYLDIEIDQIDYLHISRLIADKVGQDTMEDELIIAPHLWLKDNWNKLDSRNINSHLKNLETTKMNILIGQVKWEVVGILSQLPFIPNRFEMKYHFKNLQKLLMLVNTEQSLRIIKTIDSAILLV